MPYIAEHRRSEADACNEYSPPYLGAHGVVIVVMLDLAPPELIGGIIAEVSRECLGAMHLRRCN